MMLFPQQAVESGARLSPCGIYRYSLWRIWDKAKPVLGALLLNPSVADAEFDDPTIRRLIVRAKHLGFGGLRVCNLFALRSTSPEVLHSFAGDAIGPENDKWIDHDMRLCHMILCGWGRHGTHLNRDRCVNRILDYHAMMHLYALKINDDGTPAHPLYISYKVPLQRYLGRP